MITLTKNFWIIYVALFYFLIRTCQRNLLGSNNFWRCATGDALHILFEGGN